LEKSYSQSESPQITAGTDRTYFFPGYSITFGNCKKSFSGSRDKAMILGLLDTGARAQEFLNINLEDVELATGSILIRQGKGHKPRMVFCGTKQLDPFALIFVSD
jgi:integrase